MASFDGLKRATRSRLKLPSPLRRPTDLCRPPAVPEFEWVSGAKTQLGSEG